MATITHTQEEIVARVESITDDFFGAYSGELISALDFEHAKPYLKEGVTEADWTQLDANGQLAAASEYLAFAVGKAEDHRGLSASRSVDHFRGWVWLLAPEKFDELEAADYENYGAPKLKAAATILGLEQRWSELVPEGSRVARMADGEQCGGWDGHGCDEGCGR